MNLNQISSFLNTSSQLDCKESGIFTKFKQPKLEQQNQNLGDQSYSLQQFPSQLLTAAGKINKSRIYKDVVSEFRNQQLQIQNENSIDQSYGNCNEDTQHKFSEQNQMLFNECDDAHNKFQKIENEISQVNTKDQNISKFITDDNKLSLIETIHLSHNHQKSQQINLKEQQTLSLKQVANLISVNQKAFKKRKNLLNIENKNTKDIWKKKWMEILALVSKMQTIAKQNKLFFRPNQLKEIQIRLINDLSSNQTHSNQISQFNRYKLGKFMTYGNLKGILSFKNYRKLIKFILKYFGCIIKSFNKFKLTSKNIGIFFLKKFPLFQSQSSLYIIWEAIIFVISSTLFLYIPFEFCFNLQRDIFFIYFIQYISTIALSIDIFIKFNTLSTEQGTFIEQHLQIFSNYISSYFLLDLISMISLNSQILDVNGLQFLFFLRILQPFKILEVFREQFLLKTSIYGVLSLLYLLVQVIYFAHLFTCLWNYVGLYQLQQGQGWMVNYNFQTESVTNRYIQIFYYAIVTMTTIGYGDFTAQSQLEKLLMIFVAFFSCGIFGYTINSIGNILYDFKQKQDLYLQELAKVNKYFKQNNVEFGLQCRAKKYIQYLYSDQYCDQSCSIKSLSSLSDYLQKEIQQDVYIRMLKKVPIFREIFTEQIFSELALQVKEKIYCHDQQIINDDDQEEENESILYFINDGTILEYCQYDQKTELKEIQRFRYGQYFGLLRFMNVETNSKLKYKSVGVSSILQISYSNFKETLSKFDIEYQKFCFLKDQVIHQSNLSKIHIYCQSCQQKNHTLEQCPYLFYEGKKEIILRQYLKECNETIRNFKRRQREKSQNAILNLDKVQKVADNYYLKNIELFSLWDLSLLSQSETDYDDEEEEENKDKQNQTQSDSQSEVEEIKQQINELKLQNEQKQGEFQKRLLYDDQQRIQNDRKISLQIHQLENQSLSEQTDNNASNSANKLSVIFSGLSSKQFQDEESVTQEDNHFNQTSKIKRNKSQKKLKTKDQSFKIINTQDQEQLIKHINSQNIISTQKKLDKLQTLGTQSNKNAFKQQCLLVLKNIQSYLQQSNHNYAYCSIISCSNCSKIETMTQNLLKQMSVLDKSKSNNSDCMTSLTSELNVKKVCQSIRFKPEGNQTINQNKIQMSLNKNGSIYQQISKGSSKQLVIIFDQLFIYDFDRLRNYQFYFPNGNYQKIIEKIQSQNQHKNIFCL
ncbi:cation channel family protein (macronuclear) [Tetrahymena thermophila SB210]|uniref:Cation channel family protein n=1 Tax=Tetrahymena thermophila (strain SB210) TaxID=312017 RepID=W7XAF6_TETTS|nr:cation channel family protein [Tetrahymena thermophila SB210]EWS74312.1 cation channel family protein [Tetrahymena thermophila SB210]|eukprot:XP_012653133.1 cation channel family protein [Tetrahymena thermophila SB210]